MATFLERFVIVVVPLVVVLVPLLARICAVFSLMCPRRGGEMRIIALVTDVNCRARSSSSGHGCVTPIHLNHPRPSIPRKRAVVLSLLWPRNNWAARRLLVRR